MQDISLPTTGTNADQLHKSDIHRAQLWLGCLVAPPTGVQLELRAPLQGVITKVSCLASLLAPTRPSFQELVTFDLFSVEHVSYSMPNSETYSPLAMDVVSDNP